MTLKNNGKSLTDYRKETLLQLDRLERLDHNFISTFPEHIKSEVEYTMAANTIQINVSNNTEEEYWEIIEWCALYFKGAGTRFLSDNTGEIFHTFCRYTEDNHGRYEESVWLNKAPTNGCEIRRIEVTKTIYKSNCKELT